MAARVPNRPVAPAQATEIAMREAAIAAWVSTPPVPRERAGRAKDREPGGQR
jgi:hypothetical protein